jgi:hypothetical protein
MSCRLGLGVSSHTRLPATPAPLLTPFFVSLTTPSKAQLLTSELLTDATSELLASASPLSFLPHAKPNRVTSLRKPSRNSHRITSLQKTGVGVRTVMVNQPPAIPHQPPAPFDRRSSTLGFAFPISIFDCRFSSFHFRFPIAQFPISIFALPSATLLLFTGRLDADAR